MSHVKDGLLHFSTLKYIGTTPLHYKYYSEHDREDTDSFLVGRGMHLIVLLGKQPPFFEGRRVGSKYESVVFDNNGEDLLTAKQYDTACSMADAVLKSPLAMGLLSMAPHREAHKTWSRLGHTCSGTTDAIGDDVIIDLKGTKNAHPVAFKREAEFYRYPEQITWYDEGNGTKFDNETTVWRRAYLIAVENRGPVYPVSVHRVSPLRMLQAHNRTDEWLTELTKCQRSNNWPGWDTEINEIDAEIKISESPDFEDEA
jgi:hypothetical protein